MAAAASVFNREGAFSSFNPYADPPLNIGERVVWLGNDEPEHGSVRWMGILLDICKDWTAGVVMDNPVGGMDGHWGGNKLFDCKPKHGMIIPLNGLIKEEDFLGTGIKLVSPPSLEDVLEIDVACSNLTNGHKTDDTPTDQKEEIQASKNEGDKYIEKFLAAQSAPRTGTSSFDRRVYARMFAECEVEKWYEVLNFPQDGACGSLDVGIEKSKKKKKDSLLSERKDAALCRDSEYAEAKKKERGGIFRFFRWLRRNRSSKTSAGAGASCTRSTMHVSELGRGKTKSLESVTSLSQSFHYIPVGVRCSEDPAGMESRECVYEDLDPGMKLTPRPVASKLKCSSLSRVNCDELEKQKRGAVYEVHRPRSVRSACSPNLANSSFSRKKRRAPLPPALGTPAGRRSAGSSRNHWIKVLPGTSTETTGSTSRLSNGDVALSHLGDVNRKIASSTGAIYRDPSKILEKAGHKPLEFVSPSMHKRSSSLTVSEAPKVPSSPQCVGSHIKNKRKAPPPPSPKPSEPLLKPSKGIQTEPLNVQPADQVVQKNDAAEMVRLSSDNFTEHHRDESVVVNGMESNAKVEISNGGDGKTHEVLTVKDHPQVDKETPQDVAAKNDVVEEVKVEAEATKADEDTPPELPKKQNRGKIFQPLTLIVDEVQRLEPRRVEHKIDADLGIPEAAEMSIGCSDSTAELCAPSISKSSTVVHEAIMPPPTEVENVNDVVQSTEQPLKKPGRKSSKVSSSSDSSPVIAQLKMLCIDEDENRPKAEAEMNIQALQELVETLVDQYCDNGKYSDPIAVKNLTLEKSNDNGEEPEAALPRRQEEDLSEAAHQRYDSATRRSLSVSSGASSGWLLDEKISNLDAENAMSTAYSTMNSSTTNTTTSASDAGEDAENDDQLAGQLLERWQARMREQMINMDFNLPEKQRQSKKVVVPPPLQSQSVGEEENNGGIYEPIGNFMLHPSGSNSRAVLGESVSEGGTWKRNSLAEEQSSLRDSGEDGLQGGAEGGSGRIEGKRNFGFQATFSNTEDPDDSEIKDPFLFWRDLCARKYSDGGGDQPQAAEKLIRRLSVNGQRQPVKKADQEQCCNPESGVNKDRIVPIAACAKSLKEAKLTRESSFQSGRQMPFQIYENVFTATPHRMVVVDGISVPNQYENCIPAVAPYWAVPPAAAGPIMPYGPALQRRYAAPHYQALTVMPFMAPPMPAIYADPRFHPGGYLTPAFGNYIYSAPHGNAAVKQEVRNKSRQAEKCGAGRTPTDFLRDSPLQETSSPEESEDGCALSNLQHSDVSVAAAASAEACLADGSDRENADEHSSVQGKMLQQAAIQKPDSGEKPPTAVPKANSSDKISQAVVLKARGKSKSLDRHSYANVPPSPPPRGSSSGRSSRLAANCDWLKEKSKSVEAKIKAARRDDFGRSNLQARPRSTVPTRPESVVQERSQSVVQGKHHSVVRVKPQSAIPKLQAKAVVLAPVPKPRKVDASTSGDLAVAKDKPPVHPARSQDPSPSPSLDSAGNCATKKASMPPNMKSSVIIGGVKVPTPLNLWPLEYELIAPELRRLKARMEGKPLSEDSSLDSSDPGDVDKLAVDRLLKQLEIAIGTGKLDEAAILARDLAQLKIQCLVVRNRTPAGDGQELPIILNMFVEDKVSHHGPIPIRVLPSITVGELKTKIFHEFEFPTVIQRWILGRQLASDDKLPISSFEVNSDGCPVFLYLLSLEDMRVKAKDLVWDDDISLKNTGAQAKKREFPAKTTRAKKNIIKKIRQPMVQEQSFKTLESNAEISNTRLLGWSCANCTLVNIPTRPGCAMCGNERPTDYVVPEQYKLRESELERLEREKEQERAMIEAEELQRLQNWQHYLKLEDQDVIYNEVAFECSICFIETAPGQGVKLRDCLHSFCCECLRHAVTHSEAATVICPFRDDNYSCDSVLQEREIRALVPPDMFERYLQRSMKTAESQAPNSFHCKTPDCQGWCLIEDNANEFFCPVCSRLNCITCRAIHQELNCRQYQDKLMVLARTDDEAKKTKDAIDVMLRKGEAMNCPNCKVIIMKKWGCDWLCCSVCKTEICWVTKGPRWGPNGRGDLSAGCKCGTNGVRCHPNCTYCH